MPGAVAQRNNPANDPNVKPIKHHSNFRPNSTIFHTDRYGEVGPVFAMPVVADDSIQLRVNADVDTYTLKAPVMSPVRRNTTGVYVPLRAILPKNYELFITNPLTGDDIVAGDVNCVTKFDHLLYRLNQVNPTTPSLSSYNWFGCLNAYLEAAANSSGDRFNDNWRGAFFALTFMLSYFDMFFSKGSIANSLGINLTKLLVVRSYNDLSDPSQKSEKLSWDKLVDLLASYVYNGVDKFSVKFAKLSYDESQSGFVVVDEPVAVYCADSVPEGLRHGITFRDFIQRLHSGDVVTSVSVYDIDKKPISSVCGDSNGNRWYVTHNYGSFATAAGFKEPVNIGRIISYQLACVQFFTDDAVDYVYTTNLYHQNQYALLQGANIMMDQLFYTLNGSRVMYDSVSSTCMFNAWAAMSNFGIEYFRFNGDGITTEYTIMPAVLCAHYYLANIFAPAQSLRYRDYFVGSRKRPLGVGDTSVQVNDNLVDVVDVTKSIQMQRFLNQVNRIGRTLKAYSRGIFGVTPATNPEECVFLSNTCDIIGGEETQNTGELQRSATESITSKYRGESSKYLFEINVTDAGYIIVLDWYEITRPYLDAVPRDIFHVDRFDIFNPFLENIGDQDLKLPELGLHLDDSTFAYKMRYAEYKQSFDRAVGAFADDTLPGFAVPVSTEQLLDPVVLSDDVLSPYFIRPRSSELDCLYTSLTHYSTANYFHFIVRSDISVSANRPMEAAPQIL